MAIRSLGFQHIGLHPIVFHGPQHEWARQSQHCQRHIVFSSKKERTSLRMSICALFHVKREWNLIFQLCFYSLICLLIHCIEWRNSHSSSIVRNARLIVIHFCLFDKNKSLSLGYHGVLVSFPHAGIKCHGKSNLRESDCFNYSSRYSPPQWGHPGGAESRRSHCIYIPEAENNECSLSPLTTSRNPTRVWCWSQVCLSQWMQSR